MGTHRVLGLRDRSTGEPDPDLVGRFAAIRAELEVPEDFPPEAVAEAQRVAEQPLSLPGRDETALPLLTIDPPGSMDLDQAMHLERDGQGYRVRYAKLGHAAYISHLDTSRVLQRLLRRAELLRRAGRRGAAARPGGAERHRG